MGLNLAALKTTVVLVLAGSVVVVFTGRSEWLGGLWIATGWIAANTFFLRRMLQDVASGKMPDRRKIFLILSVKFPVLYLFGFSVLYFRLARLEGVAAAFTAYLAASAVHAGLAAANRIRRKQS